MHDAGRSRRTYSLAVAYLSARGTRRGLGIERGLRTDTRYVTLRWAMMPVLARERTAVAMLDRVPRDVQKVQRDDALCQLQDLAID